MSLQEQIAEELDNAWHEIDRSQEARLIIADSMITLLRAEVEGIECPNLGITYSPAHRSYYRDGFESCRKAGLKVLE